MVRLLAGFLNEMVVHNSLPKSFITPPNIDTHVSVSTLCAGDRRYNSEKVLTTLGMPNPPKSRKSRSSPPSMSIDVQQPPSTEASHAAESASASQTLVSLTDKLIEGGVPKATSTMASENTTTVTNSVDDSFNAMTSKHSQSVELPNGGSTTATETKISSVDLCKLLDSLAAAGQIPAVNTDNVHLRSLLGGNGGATVPPIVKQEVVPPSVGNGQLLQLLRTSLAAPTNDALSLNGGCQLLSIPFSPATLPIAATSSAIPQNDIYLLLQSAILRQMVCLLPSILLFLEA